jgi:hypothetical protein
MSSNCYPSASERAAVKQCRQRVESVFRGMSVDFGGVVSIRFCCAASVGKRRVIGEMKRVDLILIKFYLFIFYI